MKKIDSEIQYALDTREYVEVSCSECKKNILRGYFTFAETENKMKYVKHKCNNNG